MNEVTPQDLALLRDQIGRKPRGVLTVETRCPSSHPQVIKVYPLLKIDGQIEPFPTLFWLTCPRIISQISQLEHDGLIVQLEKRLAEDRNFLEEYHNNHQQYLQERWDTLTADDKQILAEKGWESKFNRRGIGGIEDWNHIKCLHLQYAHYLARKNVIGAWLDVHFDIQACQS